MIEMDLDEDAEMPPATTNQRLYLASILIGVFSAVLMVIPATLPRIAGAIGALVATGCLLAIPYNLLGQFDRKMGDSTT